MTDIEMELQSAALAMGALDCARARSMGLFNPGIAAMGSRHHQFGVARVGRCGDGLFQLDEGGNRALVVPVYEGDELVDLVAFFTSTPEQWSLRLGVGWALGLEESLERYRWGDPLPIHKTPLEWLRAGGDGLCVVDWSSPEVKTLADFASLIVGDEALERRIIAALSTPVRLPQIVKDTRLAA